MRQLGRQDRTETRLTNDPMEVIYSEIRKMESDSLETGVVSLETIQKIMDLHRQAIEYYSKFGNEQHEMLLNHLHQFLLRDDVRTALEAPVAGNKTKEGRQEGREENEDTESKDFNNQDRQDADTVHCATNESYPMFEIGNEEENDEPEGPDKSEENQHSTQVDSDSITEFIEKESLQTSDAHEIESSNEITDDNIQVNLQNESINERESTESNLEDQPDSQSS